MGIRSALAGVSRVSLALVLALLSVGVLLVLGYLSYRGRLTGEAVVFFGGLIVGYFARLVFGG